MEHYSGNVGHIDVRFVCGNAKGFNVAHGLKQIIAAAQSIDKYFLSAPSRRPKKQQPLYPSGHTELKGNQKYFHHIVSVNNMSGSINIKTKFSI
jgi:hypothetical protein